MVREGDGEVVPGDGKLSWLVGEGMVAMGNGKGDSWVNGWRKCEEEWLNMVEGSIIDRERSEYFGLMMAGVNIFKMPKFSIFFNVIAITT